LRSGLRSKVWLEGSEPEDPGELVVWLKARAAARVEASMTKRKDDDLSREAGHDKTALAGC
jgi:hypothetical protein